MRDLNLPIGMIDPFTAVLHQTTDILDARFVRVIVPRTRADVSRHVCQIQGRDDGFLVRQIADQVITAEVVAVWRDKMIVGQVELLRHTSEIDQPTERSKNELGDDIRHKVCTAVIHKKQL
jgi:hypothetical protein